MAQRSGQNGNGNGDGNGKFLSWLLQLLSIAAIVFPAVIWPLNERVSRLESRVDRVEQETANARRQAEEALIRAELGE